MSAAGVNDLKSRPASAEQINGQYHHHNLAVCGAFEPFRDKLLKGLSGLNVKVEITGSRKADLAYADSDIDFAFVVPAKADMDKVHSAVIALFTDGKTFADEFKGATVGFKGNLYYKTQSDMPWIPIIGANLNGLAVNLDCTLRTEKQNTIIQTHMVEKSKVIVGAKKASYVQMIEFIAAKCVAYRQAGMKAESDAWDEWLTRAKTVLLDGMPDAFKDE